MRTYLFVLVLMGLAGCTTTGTSTPDIESMNTQSQYEANQAKLQNATTY